MNSPRTGQKCAVVVNDDESQLVLLGGLVKMAGLVPLVYDNATSALEALDPTDPPVLVVTDLFMPGIDGWQFCRLLRSEEYAPFQEVPILVVSATYSGEEPERIASDLGAEAFFEVPVDSARFLAQIQSVLRGDRMNRRSRVLIVEDCKEISTLLQKAFWANGCWVEVVTSVREAKPAFSAVPYDMAVIDYHLSDGLGDELLDRFRTERPNCVCVMMTGDLTPGLALDWMVRGAAAYVRKPFEPAYLLELCAKARRERALLRAEKLLEDRTHELRRSEEKLRALADNTTDGLAIIEKDVIAYASPAYCLMLGYSAEEEIGRTKESIAELIHSEDVGRVLGAVENAIQEKKTSATYLYRVRRKGGDFIWREDRVAFCYAPDGTHERAYVVARDVSDRIRAEEELRHHNALLSAAATIGQHLLAAAHPEECLDEVVNLMGKASGQDRAYYFVRHGGTSDTDALFNLRYEWVREGVAPQIANPELQNLCMAVVAPYSYVKLCRGEDVCAQVRDLSGDERALLEAQGIRSLLLVPVVVDGVLDGFIGFDNCTDEYVWTGGDRAALAVVAAELGAAFLRVRTEVERERLSKELAQSQKMESIGRLAGGVAHDFNNLLSVIRGSAELALDSVVPGHPAHEDLMEILKVSDRSTNLIRQLMAFARRQPAEPRPLDLNGLVEDMLDMLRRMVGPSIKLDGNCGDGPLFVHMDPSQVDQILINLCVNARDAVGGNGRIHIRTGRQFCDETTCASRSDVAPGEYAWLSVTDDGCGMDDPTLLRIFEPFYTTKEAGKGTGLGLATVYGIVQQNHGWIRVESEPTQGSTFTIWLPLQS